MKLLAHQHCRPTALLALFLLLTGPLLLGLLPVTNALAGSAAVEDKEQAAAAVTRNGRAPSLTGLQSTRRGRKLQSKSSSSSSGSGSGSGSEEELEFDFDQCSSPDTPPECFPGCESGRKCCFKPPSIEISFSGSRRRLTSTGSEEQERLLGNPPIACPAIFCPNGGGCVPASGKSGKSSKSGNSRKLRRNNSKDM